MLKEMTYEKEKTMHILDKGTIGEYSWAIVSYGTHPCAYIGLPKSDKHFGLIANSNISISN